MLLQYVFLGTLSADNYPGIAGHIAVFGLYVLLTLLFLKSLKTSRRMSLPTITPPIYRWRSFFLVSAVFISTSVLLSTFIGALQPFASITVLLSYAVMGIGLLAITLGQMFRRN